MIALDIITIGQKKEYVGYEENNQSTDGQDQLKIFIFFSQKLQI